MRAPPISRQAHFWTALVLSASVPVAERGFRGATEVPMTQDASSLPMVPPVAGLVAQKYELLTMIGRGGMGSVWEGKHVTLGTRVAIKFIEAEYIESPEARQRFDNEARTAATLGSKHAIQIYDHGVTEEGKPYIVMELLTGEPLDKRVERLGRLSLQDATRIIQQICRALQRAHDKGIIHRDLKPENIFLVRSHDDDEEIAKLLDFGIAKFKPGATSGISSSTKTGAILGTPFYMSPEQARGLRSVDQRSDLWSLAVIVYKCVTGVLPFDGESVGDLLVKICTAPPPVPSQVLPGLPHAFDNWFARALEREPDRRFTTAQELSDALAHTCGVSIRRTGANDAVGDMRTVTDTSGANSPSAPLLHAAYSPAYTPGSPTPHDLSHAAAAATQGQFSATSPRRLRDGGLW
jgi:eukaryotic-like serine/threonine-protein kinase